MRAYLLMHRTTGTVLPGYRVTAAQEEEIHQANHRLRRRGSEYRFVVDVHSRPGDLPQALDATPA
jgi:hypothetical protein